MRLSTRIGIVLGILGLALAAAIPFRKPAPPVHDAVKQANVPIERRLARSEHGGWAGKLQSAPMKAQPLATVAATSGRFEENSAEAPRMPPKYNRTFSPVGALLNPSDETGGDEDEPELLDTGGATRALTHKIADGDTLSELASRYLGSETFADRLYEANRDVLKSPDLLPIGRVIKIPSQQMLEAAAPTEIVESEPMAPIPRGAFRRD